MALETTGEQNRTDENRTEQIRADQPFLERQPFSCPSDAVQLT